MTISDQPTPAPSPGPATPAVDAPNGDRAVTIVILGASGDLTRRLLFPALHKLLADGFLSHSVRIIGYAIDDLTTDAFLERLRAGLDEFAGGADTATWDAVRANTIYIKGDFSSESITRLAGQVHGNALFYLALPPALFATAASALGSVGLADQSNGWRRLVIEKPFGTDAASAAVLQRAIDQHWADAQVLRIDHFLGKDSVLNMLAFRFANRFVEAVWNSANIDEVQITAAETLGVEGRWRYYDGAGALRDMVQNHLMQLFALTAMEPVADWDAETLRDHKVEVLRAVRPLQPADIATSAVRGRYGNGTIGADAVPGYLQEPNIPATSSTETYAALRLWVDNWRWQGVPFLLRSGKRMAADRTEIALRLRPAPGRLFGDDPTTDEPRWIVLRLRPDETIEIHAVAKRAGLGMRPAPVVLAATDTAVAGLGEYSAYEQLLLDAVSGDHGAFIRADEAAAAWGIVQPVLDDWAAHGTPVDYPAGSDGPPPPDGCFAPGHTWRPLT